MPSPGQIGPREHEILTAVVESYIATGEPIGSRTLARINREGLSPATIRNVMSDLSEAGFLEQPHTSAGRVPTAQATGSRADALPPTASAAAMQSMGRSLLPPANTLYRTDWNMISGKCSSIVRAIAACRSRLCVFRRESYARSCTRACLNR